MSTTPASSAARLVLPAHLASGAALLAPFALALAVGGIVLTATGRDALGTYRLLLDQSFGGQIAFANTLVATTPILLAGLATAIAFEPACSPSASKGRSIWAPSLRPGLVSPSPTCRGRCWRHWQCWWRP